MLEDGTDAGIANAMGIWSRKLAGFADHPERIKRVLESLPIHPPTLPEFVALCRQQHAEFPPCLPTPKMSREEAAPRIKAAAERIGKVPAASRQWAHDIIANPKHYCSMSVKLAREALNAPPAA